MDALTEPRREPSVSSAAGFEFTDVCERARARLSEGLQTNKLAGVARFVQMQLCNSEESCREGGIFLSALPNKPCRLHPAQTVTS